MFDPTIPANNSPHATEINASSKPVSVRYRTQQELADKAIRLARKIPLGREHTPEKCMAVHSWADAVKEMLKA